MVTADALAPRVRRLSLLAVAGFGLAAASGLGACDSAVGDAGATSAPTAGSGRLQRIDALEYDRSIERSLGASLSSADRSSLVDHDGDVTPDEYQSHFDRVQLLVSAAFADPALRSRIVTCAPTAEQDNACTEAIIRRFGAVAWRRPVSDAEVSALLVIAANARLDGPRLSPVRGGGRQSHDGFGSLPLSRRRSVIQMNGKKWTRRKVLQGAGVALSLPVLETFLPDGAKARAASATSKRRYNRHVFLLRRGAELLEAKREANGLNLTSILEPLAPNKASAIVLGGIDNYGPWGTHAEPSHGNNCASAWTGVQANAPGVPFTVGQSPGPQINLQGDRLVNSGISIDQMIAKQIADNMAAAGQTPLAKPSLQYGLSTLDSSPDGVPGQHSRSISWASDTMPLYKDVSPQHAFDYLVGSGVNSMPGMTGTDPTREAPPPEQERARLRPAEFGRPAEGPVDQRSGQAGPVHDLVRTLEKRVSDPTMPVMTAGCTVGQGNGHLWRWQNTTRLRPRQARHHYDRSHRDGPAVRRLARGQLHARRRAHRLRLQLHHDPFVHRDDLVADECPAGRISQPATHERRQTMIGRRAVGGTCSNSTIW